MIDGMFCGGCAASLQKRLGQLPGVREAAVDLAAGAALISWRSGEHDTNAASDAVTALGYRARKPGAAAEMQAANDPKRSLQLKLIVALFFGMWTMMPSIGLYLNAAPNEVVAHRLALAAAIASAPVLLFSGIPFYRMAMSTLKAGVAGIDALITIGVAGAVVLSALSLASGGADVYFEVAVALITFQLIARLLQLNIVRRGRDAIAQVLDLSSPRVVRLTTDGRTEVVSLSDIAVGEVLILEAGDTASADGVIESGQGLADRHMLTGETTPVAVSTGDTVSAGEIILAGTLRLRVSANSGERRIDDLTRQVRRLLMQKSPWQNSVDVIAQYFLLVSVAAAALGAVIAFTQGAANADIAERALAVFVIACPCALALATPLAGLFATRRAAERDMVLRDLSALARRGTLSALFVDKTGTLTKGRPDVVKLLPTDGVTSRELLALAAFGERTSRHPLALALLNAADLMGIDLTSEPSLRALQTGDDAQPIHETTIGGGVRLRTTNTLLRIGSSQWLKREGLICPKLHDTDNTRIWVAKDAAVLGAIELQDPLREGVAEAIAELRQSGLTITMLSGDDPGPVTRLAKALGIDGIAQCSPEGKVAHIENAARAGHGTLFIGDGLNDGPAIAAADLGVAVCDALDAARTASAVTLLSGGVDRAPALLSLITSARAVWRQNIAWAVIYNALAVPAAVVGWVHPAVAASAMALSSVSIVLNTTRIRVSSSERPPTDKQPPSNRPITNQGP